MAVGTENPKMYQMSWGFCLLPSWDPLSPYILLKPLRPSRILPKRTNYLQKGVFNGVYKVS
jgi:hypothetical protein